jgi:hypothetical protein
MTVITGDAQQIRELLCGAPQANEHCRAWRWHQYVNGRGETDLQIRVRLDAERLARREALEAEPAAPAYEVRKVPARAMQPGDIVGSGEMIVCVQAGARTPRGRVEVVLEKDGRRRMSVWGAASLINVRRVA